MDNVTSALDVADYILQRCGTMTAMKLQKLVYYAQAWHLAWTGKPMFHEDVQAWANGPVVYELFRCHRGKYLVHPGSFRGEPSVIDRNRIESLEAVLDSYQDMTAAQLSELTHAEGPWRLARGSLPAGNKSHANISKKSMKDYYRALNSSPDTVHDVSEINFPAWAR